MIVRYVIEFLDTGKQEVVCFVCAVQLAQLNGQNIQVRTCVDSVDVTHMPKRCQTCPANFEVD